MISLNLIVAEDDPAMQHWLHTVLARMGASVRLASSGWELLSLLSDDFEAVDLVISDVRMPIPGGIDVLAMARTAGVTVPFVLITAFADEQLRDAARGMHASVLDKGHAVRLIGRADPRGTEEYNLGLGTRRAEMVEGFLLHLGIPPNQLSPATRGALDARGADEPGWQVDRQVDLELSSR